MDKQERAHIIIANALAMFMVILYSFVRSFHFIHTGRGALVPLFCLIAAITIIVISIAWIVLKNSEFLAFLIPGTILGAVSLFAFITGGTDHFFIVFLGLISISGVYFSLKYFLRFLLFANTLIFISLVIFRFPLEGYNTPMATLYIQWSVVSLCTLIVYLTVRQGVNRYTKANASMDSFLTMMETTPNMVAIVDEHTRVKYISNELAKFANIERAELVAYRPFLDLFNNPDMMDMMTSVLDNDLDSGDTAKAIIDGEERYYKVISVHLETAEKGRMIDITDVTPIMVARYQAESASTAKSDFLSKMSHEIRTPMNAIIGMTNIARNIDDPQRKEECLIKIDTASKHLLGLINDILDVSKIEADKFELYYHAFDFRKMIHNTINVVSVRSEEKKQKLIINLDECLPKFIISDELRLTQVITNLISNAVKFTPEGGTIRIKVTCGVTPNTLRIDVSDNGIGMTEEQQLRLFSAFEQADASTTRKFGGTGLGLAISKRIVEMMGGKIWIESKLGEGTSSIFTFTFKEIEYEPALEENEEFLEASLPSFSGVNILIAEDVEINREIIAALLEETEISIDFAENGMMAVSMFKENPDKYSLILMDIQMPEMDGFDATKSIRALDLEKAKTIPILAMTANVFKEDVEKCIDAGMNDHLGKPVNINEIIKAFNNYLQ